MRVGAALAAGALTGSVLVTVATSAAYGAGGVGGAVIYLVPIIFFYALVLWGVGLVLVGAPTWWVLHRLGHTSSCAAAANGFLWPALVAGAASGLVARAAGSVADAQGLLLAGPWLFGLGLVGSTVGLVIHRIAYARSGRDATQ